MMGTDVKKPRSHQKHGFLPLGQIEQAVFDRRRQRGDPVFNEVSEFSAALAGLAVQYGQRCNLAVKTKSGKKVKDDAKQLRYQSVADAASKLELALAELGSVELEALSCLRDAAASRLIHWKERDGRSLLRYVEDASLQEEAEAQAKALSRKGPTKQGKKLVAEHWAAQQFVMLCHRSGWSPVKVSNGPTETLNPDGGRYSDSTLCLGAVFHRAGMKYPLCLSQANTVLRKLRRVYVVEERHLVSSPRTREEPFYDYEDECHAVCLDWVIDL
ncbi:hypothetical protein OPU71_17530 [Niveibacterium sp. 24ML]|uniref:hypothetical protein n=1 Tax=Niveibacterium sp. 24ML TaxID=2985512 RepID=UPI00226D5153|nr:hypothetical protein [Niveibacterium sp. 24ML]MCX9157929.1 hypothetical protein [Niveibacterium sp. 24ML]